MRQQQHTYSGLLLCSAIALIGAVLLHYCTTNSISAATSNLPCSTLALYNLLYSFIIFLVVCFNIDPQDEPEPKQDHSRV